MRLLPARALALTLAAAFALLGPGTASATMPQAQAQQARGTAAKAVPWTPDKPLTGHAIPCVNGKIESFECANVELLAYLPKDSLGQSVGTDLWGWHDSTTGREFAVMGGQSTAFVEVTDPLHPRYL